LFSKFLSTKIHPYADKNLIEASFAKASWAKHRSAFNSVKKFEVEKGIKCNWPLSLNNVCEYTSWALTVAKLKPSTVKSYLSSLKIIHELANVSYVGIHPIVNSMIKGAENLSQYEKTTGNRRKVMTLSLMKIIGHQIAKSDWCDDSKLTIWGACTTAFFGALRFGEILPKKSFEFCPEETLLWKDVKFRKDGSIIIHVKIDKVNNKNGSFVDLFEFTNKNCCAVRTLFQLKQRKENPDKPVFQFENGKNLCSAHLNNVLSGLLKPVIGESASQITGHSFRAGLPSAMANNPNLANDNEIKSWGRWSSDSYKVYTRLKLKQKRALFEKIVKVLDA